MDVYPFEQLETEAVLAGERGANERLSRALAELETARAETLQRAREEGYAAGLAEARSAIGPAVAALAAAVSGVESALEEFCAVAEERAVELALQLAEKVIGEALRLDPELVLANVAGALRAAAERDHLIVEVNPDDLLLVREAAGELEGRVGGVQRLEIVPERRVPRGGCVVRTLEGEVDARIPEKLALVRELIADVRAAGEDKAGA
jgi:flagellar assembly protein FliH